MTRFYTKKGDDGYTGVLGKGRVPKYDRRIEAVGAIDEANAAIGFARGFCLSDLASAILLEVQKDLYKTMAEVAAEPGSASKFRMITAERVSWLETQVDDISSKVTIPEDFIVPGDSRSGAAIDMARAIVRRAERHIARLLHIKKIENRELLHYLNRLSSLCFVLELLENQVAGITRPTLVKD